MKDADDDHDDDPLVQSMRSVWLSMRDEDPPQRGLAELMAAARSQAEAMTPKEPWWRRAFAMLVRPPVLALATVLVLVGGAVLIDKRGSDLDASYRVQREPEAHPAPPLAQTAKPGTAGKDLAAPAAVGAQNAPAPEAAGEGIGGPTEAPPSNDDGQERDRPARHRPARGIAPPPPPPLPAPKVDDAKPTVTIDSNRDAEKAEEQRDPADDLEIARDPEDAPRPDPTTAADLAPGRTTRAPVRAPASRNVVDQLVRQTELAAGRKDCGAVRATAERVRKLDPNTYKTRLVTQKPITDCLK